MNHSEKIKKNITVVAGPNGSGKTSFAESFFQETMHNQIYLNPDLIASGFSKTDFQQASVLAGRVLLKDIKTRIAASENFVFESTLSGRTYFGILDDAKKRGYSISIYFIALKDIQDNLTRIKNRVLMGGHDIPVEAVIRRHKRCFENFWNLYRPLCHDWYIFDNSEQFPAIKMTSMEFEKLEVTKKELFEKNFLAGKVT